MTMKKTMSCLILLVGWLAGEGSLHAMDASIRFPIGLPALERMELLPLLPPNGTQTKQFISYDIWSISIARRVPPRGLVRRKNEEAV